MRPIFQRLTDCAQRYSGLAMTMAVLTKILNSVALFCLILAVPAYPLVEDLFLGDRYYAEMMHVSGVWSAQLLVASLAITPISKLLGNSSWGAPAVRWMLRRRRHIGVASFAYALLHTVHYIQEIGDVENILLEALDIELSVGWLGLLALLPLAVTSNDVSLRFLKRGWKKLHRLAYPAAVLIFVHWLLFDFFPDEALTWIAILVALRLFQALFKGPAKPGSA